MNISEMTLDDVSAVLPLYIDWYNNHEGGCRTAETAGKRIRQVLTIEDSYSLLMRDDEGGTVGFVMGYFKQYDDVVGYTLEKIVIAAGYQHRGPGSALLREVENRVREKGASCVEMQAVNDEMHERYYGKAGYKNASNFVMKVKWLLLNRQLNNADLIKDLKAVLLAKARQPQNMAIITPAIIESPE